MERKATRAKRFGIENEAVEEETTTLDLDAFSDIELEKLEYVLRLLLILYIV